MAGTMEGFTGLDIDGDGGVSQPANLSGFDPLVSQVEMLIMTNEHARTQTHSRTHARTH